MKTRQIAKYGWKRDIPDHRDRIFKCTLSVEQLPKSVDLNSSCPPAYNQTNMGSCTANSIGLGIEYAVLKEKSEPDFMPSRLFIYYNERLIENTVKYDSGAQIRDGIKSVNKQGVCPEKYWPYDIKLLKRKPNLKCYKIALTNLVSSYHSINQDLISMKTCLAEGFPFVFGFTVYDSFESQDVAGSGIVNLPLPNENIVGGHAVTCIGYDDATQRFLVRNSWGSEWGQNGNFTIPYAYLTNPNLASDFWTIRVVE